MGRGAKHTLYGLLFLFVLSLIAATVYLLFFKVKPSCEDGILNQEEEGLDCGGPCIACEIKNFELVRSEVEIIPVGEARTTLIATITNVSRNYGATDVNYNLDLRSLIGGGLDLIEGKTTVPPATTRYIVVPGLSINPSDVGRIQFEVEKDFDLVPEKDLVQHEVIIKQTKPVFSEGVMRIEGIAANNTGKDINVLKLSALIRDGQGKLISAATTVVDKLSAFKGRGFVIFAPILSGLSLDGLETEILWEVTS